MTIYKKLSQYHSTYLESISGPERTVGTLRQCSSLDVTGSWVQDVFHSATRSGEALQIQSLPLSSDTSVEIGRFGRKSGHDELEKMREGGW